MRYSGTYWELMVYNDGIDSIYIYLYIYIYILCGIWWDFERVLPFLTWKRILTSFTPQRCRKGLVYHYFSRVLLVIACLFFWGGWLQMTTHVSIDPQAMGCGSNPDTLCVHTKIAGVGSSPQFWNLQNRFLRSIPIWKLGVLKIPK